MTLVVFATKQHIRLRGIRAFVHHIGHRAALLDRELLGLHSVARIHQLLINGIHLRQPVGEKFLHFRLGARSGRFGSQPFQTGDTHQLDNFVALKRPSEDFQILQPRVRGSLAGIALANFEWHGGADGAIEVVIIDIHLLQFAVHIDAYAFGLR